MGSEVSDFVRGDRGLWAPKRLRTRERKWEREAQSCVGHSWLCETRSLCFPTCKMDRKRGKAKQRHSAS